MSDLLLIVLTGLKIIGVLLLAVLGILLLLLFTVLLVPLRWQGRCALEEKPEGMLNLTWLFHLLSIRLSYQETFKWSVKLFGHTFWEIKEEEEDMASAPELSQGNAAAPEERLSEADREETAQAEVWDEIDRSRKKAEEELKDSDFGVSIQEQKKSGRARPPKKKAIWKKKLSSLLQSVKTAFRQGKEMLQKGSFFYGRVTGFLCDEANQKTFCLLKHQLSRLIRHLFPRKIQGELTFGVEDPYVMGQLLSAAAFLYPLYAEQVMLVPVFDEAVLRGNLQMKGRIRIGTLLCVAGRLLLHQNFRTLVKKFLNRGGK